MMMEDKPNNLHTLNGRLQKYVMRVQQITAARDQAQHDLVTMRERMEKEMTSVKSRLSKELEGARAELELEIDQKTRLQVLEQEQYAELTTLRKEAKELRDAKTTADRLKIDIEKERLDSSTAKEALASRNTELASLKRRSNTMVKEMRKISADLKDAITERDRLRDENAEFLTGRDQAVDALRKEWHEKSRHDHAAWKDASEKRVAQVEKEAKEHSSALLETKQQQLDTLQEELTSTKKELETTATDYENGLLVREELSARVTTVEKQYREDRKVLKDDKRTMEEIIAKLRAESALKEKEFNVLMDSKIALDAEISTYRMILEQEESRVGSFKTPNPKAMTKKRKSTGKRASAKKPKFTSHVFISQLDILNDIVVVTNSSNDKIMDLKGWKITGQSGEKTFTFPAFELKPGAKVMVKSGRKGKKSDTSETPEGVDVFATRKFMWNSNGDVATLLSDKNEVMHRTADGMTYEQPENESEGESEYESRDDIDMEPLPNLPENHQCSIM